MNRWERKLHRFRAGIYIRLPRHSKLLKVQVTVMVLFLMMLGKEVFYSMESVDKDEPVSGESVLVIEYAESEIRKQGDIVLPGGLPDTVISPTPTPMADTDTEEGESIQVGNEAYQTVFHPACYPVLSDIVGSKYLKENLLQLDYLKDNFYIVNATTKMTEKDFDVDYFLNRDFSVEKKAEPQILIYHTHASEGFADSRAGKTEDTVVGVGEELARILTEKYGYCVMHDTTVFDKKNGKDNRNYAYNDALEYMEKLLKEYPSIEIIIDLHRDAGAKRVVTIDGKQVAKVMLFNGLCRNSQGEVSYLPNKNLADNLAFSFQMKLLGDEMYPGFMNRIFLKDYRYNMHLTERYLLVELGTEKNTVAEAKNAMEPLADILAQVLSE